MIKWKEIKDKNMSIWVGAFLKLWRDYLLIPKLFNIEQLQDILWATIPPITQSEYLYFDNNKLIKLCEDSGTKNYRYIPNYEEPEMLFHEFVFVLGRVALIHVTNTNSDDPSIEEKFQILLEQNLDLKMDSAKE